MSAPNKIPGSDVSEDNGLSCPYSPAPVSSSEVSSSEPISSSSSETVIAVRDGVEYVQDDARQMSYSRPVSSSLPAHHVLLMTAPAASSQDRRAAYALGRALERVIGEMERNGEIIPVQVRELCDILKRGEFPTHDEVWNNPFFNQSLADTRLDAVVHAVAVKAAGDNQLHQTALALSLNQYFSQNPTNPADQDIRQGLITALSTDTQSRTLLAQATQNSNNAVRTEVAQAAIREATVAAGSAAAAGGFSRGSEGIASIVAPSAPTPLQNALATAVRVASLTSPTVNALTTGAGLVLTVLGLERGGLPPYQESLLWPYPVGGLGGQGNYIPLVTKEIPYLREALGIQSATASSSEARSAEEAASSRRVPEAPVPVGSGSRAPAPEGSAPSHSAPVEPPVSRPSPPPASNTLGTTATLTQVLLGTLPSPFTLAAVALQGAYNVALLSQASSHASHSAFSSYAPYAIAAVNSASETHSDADANHSDSGHGQSGGQGREQQDENPKDERHPEQDVYLA